jgi:hypothetical protein
MLKNAGIRALLVVQIVIGKALTLGHSYKTTIFVLKKLNCFYFVQVLLNGMISAAQKQKAHTCKMPSTSTNMPRPLCAGTSAWILLYNDTPATTPARPRMNPTNWMPAWR